MTRFAIAATLAIFLFSTCGFAQVLKRPPNEAPPSDSNQSKINAKSKKHWPRAIAVLEFLPGGGARLVPVALWIDDHFYDASLYGANPEPMAVAPETVYEAMDYGEPTGLFTVTNPKEVKGNWVADGRWNPHRALDEKVAAAQKAKQPTPMSSSVTIQDDDRPVLHRPGSKGSSKNGGSNGSDTGAAQPSDSSSAPPTAEDDPDRPTLKKPQDTSTTASTPSTSSSSASSEKPGAQTSDSGGTPAAADNDPDRPTLKKPASDASAASSTAPSSTQTAQAAPSSENAPSPDESDPNRPVLRRGKAEPAKATSQPASTSAGSQTAAMQAAQNQVQAAANKMTATLTSAGRRSFPAVSYAGPYEPRSLLYALNAEERTSKSEQMRALALDEIRKFMATRHTPALPKNAAISDYDLRSFDLQYTNSPTLVLTATLPVQDAKTFGGGEFHYFVTVVAHVDLNDTPVKIFSSVTDSNHLDAFPRMEIIDAVDADANGRGDLLFRQYSDSGISYSLYRVFPYDMQKVFEGGSGV